MGNINRIIGVGVVSAAGLLVAWFFASQWISQAPNRTAAAVMTAINAQHPDDLAGYIDTPRLEASLKSEIDAAIAYRKANPEKPGVLRLLFGTVVTLMVLPDLFTPNDPERNQQARDAVNSIVKPPRPADPELDVPAVAHGLTEPKAFVKFVTAALGNAQVTFSADGDMMDFVRRRIEAPDDNTRIVTLSPDGFDVFVQSKESKLIFERRGLWNWVVAGMDLPEDGGPLFQQADAPAAAAPATPQQ